MEKVLLATTNRNKIEEFRSLWNSLSHLADRTCLVTPDELGIALPNVLEDGDTPQANARLKAISGARATGYTVLADDTILMVDHLDGRPGLLTARYAGPHATMDANRKLLLEELSDCEWEKRGATFLCCLTLVSGQGEVRHEVQGTCRGIILGRESPNAQIPSASQVTVGFGYDRLFWMPSVQKTMAELNETERNTYTHRARALRQLPSFDPRV
jgi:XTP/dITP diphosphohydrolase